MDAVIQEYIETARPVASRGIMRKFRIDVSPATIRHEMGELDEMGYLEQPHTSAGRIPTDQGYRFYIDEIAENKRISAHFTPPRAREVDEFFHEATKIMAELSHSFAVFGMPGRHNFEKSGFSEIMQEPEFADEVFAHDFGELADEIEEAFDVFFRNLEEFEEPKVFIGSESPIQSGRRCGMVVSQLPVPANQNGFFALIGPKRMDYRRNISLINELQSYARRYVK